MVAWWHANTVRCGAMPWSAWITALPPMQAACDPCLSKPLSVLAWWHANTARCGAMPSRGWSTAHQPTQAAAHVQPLNASHESGRSRTDCMICICNAPRRPRRRKVRLRVAASLHDTLACTACSAKHAVASHCVVQARVNGSRVSSNFLCRGNARPIGSLYGPATAGLLLAASCILWRRACVSLSLPSALACRICRPPRHAKFWAHGLPAGGEACTPIHRYISGYSPCCDGAGQSVMALRL